MAAAGWGGAIMLYPSARPLNEILLVFAVGGVMLAGASTLAARPEAFVTFLLPTGFLTSLRLAGVGDKDHLMMGLLGAVFTVATVLSSPVGDDRAPTPQERRGDAPRRAE